MRFVLAAILGASCAAAYGPEKSSFKCLLVRPVEESKCCDLSSEYLFLDDSVKHVDQLKCAKSSEYGCFRLSKKYGIKQRVDEKHCGGCRDVAYACDPSECYLPPHVHEPQPEDPYQPPATQDPYMPPTDGDGHASYRFVCHTNKATDYALCRDYSTAASHLTLSEGTTPASLKCATTAGAVCWDLEQQAAVSPEHCNHQCKDTAFACPPTLCKADGHPSQGSYNGAPFVCHAKTRASMQDCGDFSAQEGQLTLAENTLPKDLTCATTADVQCFNLMTQKHVDDALCGGCKDVAFACPKQLCHVKPKPTSPYDDAPVAQEGTKRDAEAAETAQQSSATAASLSAMGMLTVSTLALLR